MNIDPGVSRERTTTIDGRNQRERADVLEAEVLTLRGEVKRLRALVASRGLDVALLERTLEVYQR